MELTRVELCSGDVVNNVQIICNENVDNCTADCTRLWQEQPKVSPSPIFGIIDISSFTVKLYENSFNDRRITVWLRISLSL
jgi:hypothetical protein